MERKVKFPAIGLIVLGVLGVLAGLFGMIQGAVDPQQLIDAGVPEDQAELIAKYSSSGGIALNILGIAVSCFIIWAGLQMMKLKSWTACVVANILIMIPCFTSCCCLVGIPIGVWGLVQLFNADVKRAFQSPVAPGDSA
jgi:hypothetical protein